MIISYHSLLMQTQPFLFYQLVNVYHAVATFGLSNIVTNNFVTLCFYLFIFIFYCQVYVHTVHTPSGVIAITISIS